MTDQHRATPEDWGLAKSEAEDGSHTDSCLLELCSRVEALERQAAMNELPASSADARPTVKDSLTDAGSLVERVARSIERTVDFNPDSYAPEARAAICEVAAWLREGGDYSANAWADMLEREADRG
jgi:hypothetical protein